MASNSLSVLDSTIRSYENEARARKDTVGTIVKVSRAEPASSSADELHRPLHHEDYHLALVPTQTFTRSTGPRFQSSMTHQLFIVPVTWQELLERLRREITGSTPDNEHMSLQFGEVRVDFLTMRVTRSEERVHLTAQQFKLLRFLTQAPERVFQRKELLNQVWGYNHYPSTRTVDNHIYSLRQKLELNPARPIHFLTVHRTGYKFVP